MRGEKEDDERFEFSIQDLSNWFLVGVDLRGTNLYYANLGGTNLYGATYDKNTVFPDDFDPVVAGMNKIDTEF